MITHKQGGRPAAELEWRKDGKRVVDLQKVGRHRSLMILTDYLMEKFKL